MANLLFTEEALSMMNEKLVELAEERREMEYQEWLHADQIDDRDYERETYEALGGDDYDQPNFVQPNAYFIQIRRIIH